MARRSRLSTRSTFLLNITVTPAASLYAASSRRFAFTRSAPSKNQSPGRRTSRSAVKNRAARPRRSCRWCCPGTRPAAARPRACGQKRTCSLKSPTTALIVEPRIVAPQRRGRVGDRRQADVERHEPAQAARVAERVQQQARLLRASRAELDQRRRLGRARDVARARAQDLALAPGQVVLGLAGDRLEQLRAALVVEPLRRQLLRCRGQTAARLGPQQRDAIGLGEQDLGVQARGPASRPAGPTCRRVPGRLRGPPRQ